RAQPVSVSGRVASARGGVIANAEVTLHLLPPPGQPAMRAMPGMAADLTTTTGADGAFTFARVPPGQYVLTVDSPGFERASQELVVANQPQTVTAALTPLEVPGAETPAAALNGTSTDPAALLDRIKALEQRIVDLESGTV